MSTKFGLDARKEGGMYHPGEQKKSTSQKTAESQIASDT